MFKLIVDAISGSFAPPIEKAISNLEDAKDKINSIQMPTGFSYSATIRNTIGKISNIITKIKNIEKNINDTVNQAIETEKKNKSLIDSLLGGLTGFGADYLNYKTKQISSEANVLLGFIKGLGNVGEAIIDTAAMIGTFNNSNITTTIDGIAYLATKATGTEEKYVSITSQMWKNTAGFIAKDHVNDAYENFYNNNTVGKWLDENAYEPFKSDGAVTNIASGIGEVVGIMAITAATGGVATASLGISTAAVGAITAGIVGTGNAAEKYWGDKVANSWEGIEQEYKKGNITKEEYNTMKEIRETMTEKDIDKQLESGKITKEEAESYKEIINMPEGITDEDIGKGIIYSIGNGVWEGAQWYLGGKLAGWKGLTSSKLGTSAIRVGVDTAFNALDTPYRTILEATTTDETLKEAWENQGGWTSLLANTAIGLVGSAGGEIFDNFGNDTIKNKLLGKNETNNDFEEAKKFICKKFNLDSKTVSDQYVINLANYCLSNTDKMNFEKIINKELAKTLSVGEKKLQKIISKHLELNEEASKSVQKMLTYQNYLRNIYLEKMSNEQIENYISIYKKVAEQESMYKNYFKKNKRYLFISEERISEAFDNVTIFETKNEYVDYLVKKTNYTRAKASNTKGVCIGRTQSVLYKEVIKDGTTIHEINHALGTVNNKFKEEYRAINEAFTQSLTRKIYPYGKPDGYDSIGIVDTISKITEMLEDVGYKDIDIVTYFSQTSEYYQKAVDRIAGKGFYDALANAMMKAHDGFLKDYDRTKGLRGQQEMNGLLDYFENIISEIKRGEN